MIPTCKTCKMVKSEAITVTDHSAFKSKLQRQQQGLDVIFSDPETRLHKEHI